jgi:hypothetical protein
MEVSSAQSFLRLPSLLHIPESLGSNLGLKPSTLTEVLCGFPQALQANAVEVN